MITLCVVASTVPAVLACAPPTPAGWVTFATCRVSVMGISRDLVVPDLRSPPPSPLRATEPQFPGYPNTQDSGSVSSGDYGVKFSMLVATRWRRESHRRRLRREWSQGESNPRYRRERPAS